MRPFARRFKLILVGLGIFFLACLTINYIDFKKINNHRSLLNIIEQREEQFIQTNFIEGSNRDDLLEDAFEIIPKNTTSKALMGDENIKIKKHYVAFDGGGFGSVNTGLIKCNENLEVEVVGEPTSNVNISFFHMSLPGLPQSKEPYSMVFTMESEVCFVIFEKIRFK